MDESAALASVFERERPRLRSLAYRLLGSLSDADDALQDAWLRADAAGADGIDNVPGWLTTIVARTCLNQLRTRRTRGEVPLSLPDPIVTSVDADPASHAELADAVALALLVVLDTLAPAERVAFVLHDVFDVPFETIARIVEKSPDATRQLASRGRRRVSSVEIPRATVDLRQQRAVVDAFFAAARSGDFDALIGALHPDAVLRSQVGSESTPNVVVGAATVAGQSLMFAHPTAELRPVLVNGSAGVLVVVGARPVAVMGFTVVGDVVREIDAIADPARVARLAADVLAG